MCTPSKSGRTAFVAGRRWFSGSRSGKPGARADGSRDFPPLPKKRLLKGEVGLRNGLRCKECGLLKILSGVSFRK